MKCKGSPRGLVLVIQVLLALVVTIWPSSRFVDGCSGGGCAVASAFAATNPPHHAAVRPLSSTTILRAQPEDADRSGGLRRALSNVGQVFTRDTTVRVGSTVVANSNVPNLQIWQFQSYTVEAIWDQGVPVAENRVTTGNDDEESSAGTTTSNDNNSLLVERIPCDTLDATPTTPPGYTRYVSLFSPQHHERPVTVCYPDEVVLVPLRDEVLDSVVTALPLFGFWTALAWSFAYKYNARYGGDFVDALFRSKGL